MKYDELENTEMLSIDEQTDEELLQLGCVYRIHCKPTGRNYIGQTVEYKFEPSGHIYPFGAKGRWIAHVSESKDPRTKDYPLHQAIIQYGRDAFIREILEYANLDQLDAIETKYIEKYDSVYPNGYNVASHGRRPGDALSLANELVTKTISIDVRVWKRGGSPQVVAIYLSLDDGKERRICFGSGRDITFEEAVSQSEAFLKVFKEANISIRYDHTTQIDDLAARYQEPIDQLNSEGIKRVLVSFMNARGKELDQINQLGVYVYTPARKLAKLLQTSFTCGNSSQGYQVAKAIIRKLAITNETSIVDNIGPLIGDQLEIISNNNNLTQLLQIKKIKVNLIDENPNVSNRRPRVRVEESPDSENGVNSPEQSYIIA